MPGNLKREADYFVNAFLKAYKDLSFEFKNCDGSSFSSFCPRDDQVRFALSPQCPKVYRWFKNLVEEHKDKVPFNYVVVKEGWREQFKSHILPLFASNGFLSPPLTDDLITSLFGSPSCTKLIFDDETQELFIECDTDSEHLSDLEELFSIKALLDTVYVDSEENATIAFKENLSLLSFLQWKEGEEGEEEKQYLFHKEVKPLCLSWLGVPEEDKKRKREERENEGVPEDKKRKIDVL
jgi:hypothetical protein